jgi:hypothetical protein
MEGAVIVLIVFFSITLIFGIYAYTRHRERMAMLDKGLSAEDIRSINAFGMTRINPLSSLKWGIVFITIGVAVLTGMWLSATFNVEEGVYPGLISLFAGLGLVIFYTIAGRKAQL